MVLRFIVFSLLFAYFPLPAQSTYWQQHVAYTMAVDIDTENHQFSGKQVLLYTNNSPDTLHQVFYHLYYNAFQPGSMMAERTASIADPDKRMDGRFASLKPNEIGYQRITKLTQHGEELISEVVGTVFQVPLKTPILPGATDSFYMEFNAQIPIQIRRTGRTNKEDIDYTMTQWYPKMAAYDAHGWHPDQYVAREFYGDFGSFDVTISIDPDYVVGGTGVLQPAMEKRKPKKNQKRTWHFKADQVHDFAWAADPDFQHDSFQIEGGPTIHLYYNPETANVANWQNCHDDIKSYFSFMAEHYGPYAYPQFSLIQGGDGGMEYPMCTMMLGGGKSYRGFFGLFAHEATHNWFYGMLGYNEQRYAWMDEGLTSFAEEEAMHHVFNIDKPNPHVQALANYITQIYSGQGEPMTTPADHYSTNRNYVISTYRMGELFLMQLRYILGEAEFDAGMMTYYARWKFKHSTPDDLIKVMEEVSSIQLDWFLAYWTKTTKITDYAIANVENSTPYGTLLTLENNGERPMPVDILVTYKNGTVRKYTIPLLSMYGHKEADDVRVLPAWPWTRKTYEILLDFEISEIDRIILDPNQESCDVFTLNNEWIAED